VAEARQLATEARRLDPADPRARALLDALPR
jgi:cytochrome c-type biogenesis protein CcmH/NrfG